MPSAAVITTARHVLLIAVAAWATLVLGDVALHSSTSGSWSVSGACGAAYQRIFVPYASHRLAEAMTAVASFALSGALFTVLRRVGFRKMGEARPTDDQRRMISGSSHTFLFWVLANIGVYMGLIDLSQRIFQPVLEAAEVIAAPPTEPPSLARLLVEVGFSVWAYDFVFYWVHRSFHAAGAAASVRPGSRWRVRLLRWWHDIHLTHHDHYTKTSAPLHALVTFHHHFLDAALQVGVNIVVQQVPLAFLWPGPRHVLSKHVHNVLVTYLLVEAHSGFDLPFMSHRVLPALLGGAVRHQEHHHVGRKHFHQFFKYLDDILGPL